jgi:hypothetical protein
MSIAMRGCPQERGGHWLETARPISLLSYQPLNCRTCSGRWLPNPLEFTEPFRRHIKWLGDSHSDRAVALPASGWAAVATLSDHTSHSSAKNEYKRCAWCGKTDRRDPGSACEVRATLVVPGHSHGLWLGHFLFVQVGGPRERNLGVAEVPSKTTSVRTADYQ